MSLLITESVFQLVEDLMFHNTSYLTPVYGLLKKFIYRVKNIQRIISGDPIVSR